MFCKRFLVLQGIERNQANSRLLYIIWNKPPNWLKNTVKLPGLLSQTGIKTRLEQNCSVNSESTLETLFLSELTFNLGLGHRPLTKLSGSWQFFEQYYTELVPCRPDFCKTIFVKWKSFFVFWVFFKEILEMPVAFYILLKFHTECDNRNGLKLLLNILFHFMYVQFFLSPVNLQLLRYEFSSQKWQNEICGCEEP